jgi:KDO2-lipid IV(A) lauroyltransferase
MRALLILMWLLHWLPLPILGRIGEGIGSLLYILVPKRRHIALTNLRLCMPQLSEAERIALAKKHFRAYSRSIWERGVLWWAPVKRLNKLIVVEPGLPLDAIKAGPTIILCPHFVCLDVVGVALMQETSLCVIYSRQSSPALDKAMHKGRTRFRPIKIFPRSDGIKPILRAMRDGLPFVLAGDMDFGSKDAEFIPFFGIPASTLTALPRIAAATGAKVIPVVATYLPNYQGWKVKFYPQWNDYPGTNMTDATRKMNAFVEERVLEKPAEYFWTHKRFKTRPAGEPSIYASRGSN